MAERKIALADLRSQRRFAAPGHPGNMKSVRTKQMGFAGDDFKGKPVIGILSTWSDLASCDLDFLARAGANPEPEPRFP